jgi:predicted secreted protein
MLMKALKSIRRTEGMRLLVAALAAALAIGSAASAMGANPITDDNVEAAMGAAKTPADHEALAAYFTAKANEASANVEKHQRMSRLFGGKQKTSWEAHCRDLIKTFEEQAKDYAALAKEQRAVAAALAK